MAEQSYLAACVRCDGTGIVCPICDRDPSDCDHTTGDDPFEIIECPTCRGTGEHPNGGSE